MSTFKKLFFTGVFLIAVGLILWFWNVSILETSVKKDVVVRAAIDVGSGATKLKVAEVDLKNRKIEKILVDQQFSVPYQESFFQSPTGEFDEAVMEQGLDAMRQAHKIASKYGADKVIAVATAAFRKAGNSQAFINKIREETGIEVFIIDQALEGKLAYEAANAQLTVDPEKMVVWDIGGGSLQMTALDEMGNYQIYRGHKASIPFRNFIIENIQGKSLNETTSPNPMTSNEIEVAITDANKVAQDVDDLFRKKLQDPETEVVGVGSIFAYGIYPLMDDQDVYTSEALAEKVRALSGKTDEDMGGGDFADVSISNAILILGFMEDLEIDKVRILNVNNADGAFLYDSFWVE